MSYVYLSSGSIMEKMMDRMERYTANLEQLVVERTQEAKDQQQRAETLLMEMLPKSVAERLQQGVAIEPEQYDGATVLFTDIVEFTHMASKCTPIQIITFLNEIYNAFDSLIDRRNVYKVETVGDSYMVVSGVPNRTDKHAFEIIGLALDMRDFMAKYILPFQYANQMHIRIGAHSGPVVSGIVGSKMPRYCLFGDTVNYASRMKSTGEPMKIQISKDTRKYLKHCEKYEIQKRGEIEVKGKGLVLTYYVDRADGVSSESLHLAKDELRMKEAQAKAKAAGGKLPAITVNKNTLEGMGKPPTSKDAGLKGNKLMAKPPSLSISSMSSKGSAGASAYPLFMNPASAKSSSSGGTVAMAKPKMLPSMNNPSAGPLFNG